MKYWYFYLRHLPIITITPEGIWDKRITSKSVDWRDIKDVKYILTKGKGGSEYLRVSLKNKDYYFGSSFINKLLFVSKTKFDIHLWGLSLDTRTIIKNIDEKIFVEDYTERPIDQ